MFSKRADWRAPTNRLTLARERARASGRELLDLTETNPTRAGLAYPLEEIASALAAAAHAPYTPDPLGLPSAREALAEHLGCDAGDLVLTASTSEAYSFLFKLLTDPGDVVLTATPSYPLLEHLAALEQVTLRTFALEFHRRWEVPRIPDTGKAIVLVSPNNPTGSLVTKQEQDGVAAMNIPIISDEVFRDFAFIDPPPSIVRDDVLTFTLGGLSKSAGLPHLKLAWIRVSGPHKHEAIAALELIADNFLSVATPVQVALPELLRIAPRIRESIQRRTRANLEHLTRALHPHPSVQLLPVEGGWSAVIRMPRTRTDEELALHLLEERGVIVQPGYFFDFEQEGYIVLSLLTPREVFEAGVERMKDEL